MATAVRSRSVYARLPLITLTTASERWAQRTQRTLMRCSRLRSLVWLALALTATGCARVEFVPPTPEVRAQLGTVAIVDAPAATKDVDIKTPVKGAGAGALSGAGQGALGSIVIGGGGGCQGGGPYGCALGLALGIAIAPVAALVGAGIGAAKAHEAEVVEAAEASVRAALQALEPGRALRDKVVATVCSSTALRLAEPMSIRFAPSYRSLSEIRVDTVLELRVTRFGLDGRGSIDPDVWLAMRVESRLVRASDDSELYRRVWGYDGIERNFIDTAANDARPLRDEIDHAQTMIADKVVHDLFVSTEPEPRMAPQQARGTVYTVEGPQADPAKTDASARTGRCTTGAESPSEPGSGCAD